MEKRGKLKEKGLPRFVLPVCSPAEEALFVNRKPTLVQSPDIARENRVPPGQHLTAGLPVLHHGTVPAINPALWKLHLFGLVQEEVNVDRRRFQALPRVKVHCDVHCVTGWSRLDTFWEGVSTATLRDLVQIKPEARFALVHAPGGFTTNLSLEEFFAEDVLLADRFDGKPLTPEHGFPVRLVVPRLYFWKSAKWVTGVEFLAEDRPGFWESAGYHNHGDPWKEERYQ